MFSLPEESLPESSRHSAVAASAVVPVVPMPPPPPVAVVHYRDFIVQPLSVRASPAATGKKGQAFNIIVKRSQKNLSAILVDLSTLKELNEVLLGADTKFNKISKFPSVPGGFSLSKITDAQVEERTIQLNAVNSYWIV